MAKRPSTRSTPRRAASGARAPHGASPPVQPRRKTSSTKPTASRPDARAGAGATPRLLSGGNPQIAKGDGEAPVRAYITAMSGAGAAWKRDIGERLDALIAREVPSLRRAVKWNSPFYGVPDEGARTNWFLSAHCYERYVKIAFFAGASLRPPPPGASKQPHVRYLDVREGDWGTAFSEAQLADWVRQASRQPGWLMHSELPAASNPAQRASKPAARVSSRGVSRERTGGRSRTSDQPTPTPQAARSCPPDWRVQALAGVRALIAQADPDIVEEIKWRKPSNAMAGVPAWSHPGAGLICTGETYKDKVKLTFARGASLADPAGLFNASLDAGTRRAIDLFEGDAINARAFKSLIRAAVDLRSKE